MGCASSSPQGVSSPSDGPPVPDSSMSQLSPDELIDAARENEVAIIKEILAKNPEVVSIAKLGPVALRVAIKNGHLESAKVLCEQGVDVNAKNKTGSLVLEAAMAESNSAQLIALLVAHKANIDDVALGGWTSLMHASAAGCVDSVKALVKAGAKVDLTNEQGWTALNLTANSKTTEAAKVQVASELLVQGKCDVNLSEEDGLSPLMCATYKGHTALVKLLLDEHADTELKEHEYGNSAIHFAAMQKGNPRHFVEILQLLLAYNANVNAQNVLGYTPAIYAAFYGFVDYIAVIVKQPLFDPKIQNNTRENALDAAQKTRTKQNAAASEAIVRMLQDVPPLPPAAVEEVAATAAAVAAKEVAAAASRSSSVSAPTATTASAAAAATTSVSDATPPTAPITASIATAPAVVTKSVEPLEDQLPAGSIATSNRLSLKLTSEELKELVAGQDAAEAALAAAAADAAADSGAASGDKDNASAASSSSSSAAAGAASSAAPAAASSTSAKSSEPAKHEGFMLKRGDWLGAMKRRYFVLEKGTLSYYDDNPKSEPKAKYLGKINLRDTTLTDLGKEAHKGLTLGSNKRASVVLSMKSGKEQEVAILPNQMVLLHGNGEEKDVFEPTPAEGKPQWMNAIQAHIDHKWQ